VSLTPVYAVCLMQKHKPNILYAEAPKRISVPMRKQCIFYIIRCSATKRFQCTTLFMAIKIFDRVGDVHETWREEV